MTGEQIKQLVKKEFASMARLGRALNPPVTGQAVSRVIDGRLKSQRLRQQIADKLGLRVALLPAREQ